MSPALLGYHDHHFSYVVARLRPEVSLANALSQVEAVQYRLHTQYLNNPVAEDVVSRTLMQDLAKDVTKPLIVLLCAVTCMLLIGCLNVANLLVARSAAAERDRYPQRAGGAKGDADSHATDGEPAGIDCRRSRRSAVVTGGNEVAGEHMERSSQRAEYPRGWRRDDVCLWACLCRGLAGRATAGDLIHRRPGDCGTAGFGAERDRQPGADGAAQNPADN
jgi:hypothetical protein